MYISYKRQLWSCVDQYPWLILDQPSIDLDWHLISMIFSSQFVKSQLFLGWCMWLSWHSAHFLLSVDQESTEYQLGCRSSVNQEFDWVSITGRLRVLIDTRPHMHLVNMIYFLKVYYVSAGQTSLLQVQWGFTLVRVYININLSYRKYVKINYSVNRR